MQIVLCLLIYFLYKLANKGLDILDYKIKHIKREDRYQW